MAKRATNEERRKLIDLVFDKGFKLKDAALAMGMKYPKAYAIVSIFLKTNRIDKKTCKAPNTKYGPFMKEEIVNWFGRNTEKTIEECRTYLRENGDRFNNLVPSKSTIDRILSQADITFKRLSIVPPRRNTPETIKMRKYYAIKYTSLEAKGKHFVWMDEFGCNMGLHRKYGRSLKGTPAHSEGSINRGYNLTCCAAIDQNGPIYYTKSYGGFDQFAFKDFLQGLLLKVDTSKDIVFICDNVPLHKTLNLQQFTKDNKMNLLYLPPYSPMLNPIEECFAKVKNELCKELKKKVELGIGVDNSWKTVTQSDCQGWIRHMKEFFPQCFAERPIYKDPEPVFQGNDENLYVELYNDDDEMPQDEDEDELLLQI